MAQIFTQLPDGSLRTDPFPDNYDREFFYEELKENNREVDREIALLNKVDLIAIGVQWVFFAILGILFLKLMFSTKIPETRQ